MTLLYSFRRKATHLFLCQAFSHYEALSSVSEGRPSPPQGFCSVQTQARAFPALCRRHVVKAFGSDCLTAVGDVCVRASFMAVEI